MIRTKQRSCEGKTRHDNRRAALAHIRSLARETGAHAGRFDAYRCDHCKFWHVGHRAHKKRVAW